MIKGNIAETDVFGYCRADRVPTQQVLECPLDYTCACRECEEFEPDDEVDDEDGFCEAAGQYVDDMDKCPHGGAVRITCSECGEYIIKEEEE